jgi:RimJ/RimL family protein N-acetyltransferase
VSGTRDDPPAAPVLRTERLLLRHFVAGDLQELRRVADDADIARNTLRVPHPYTVDDARSFLARVQEDVAAGGSEVFAICEAETGARVGAIGLHIERDHQRAELGYWIGADWRRRGFAREAGRAVLEHAFTRLGLGRVFASHYPWNPASGRVLSAIGMRYEGTLRGHHLKDGRRVDAHMHGILGEDHAEQGHPPPSAVGATNPAGAGG